MYINVTSCHFPLIQSLLLCNHVMLIRCVTATGACHRHGCASMYLLYVHQPLCLCGRSRRRRAGLRGKAAIGSAGSLHPAPLRPSLQQSGAALPGLLLLYISDRRDSHPASQTRPPGGRSSSSSSSQQPSQDQEPSASWRSAVTPAS